jgi:hypothetical protein
MAKAMMKVIEYEVSYYQTRAAAVSRQLIENALPIDFIFGGGYTPQPDYLVTDTGVPIVTDDGQNILVD